MTNYLSRTHWHAIEWNRVIRNAIHHPQQETFPTIDCVFVICIVLSLSWNCLLAKPDFLDTKQLPLTQLAKTPSKERF